ncbi:MAG: HDIG domain-containing protein [Desulfitobacterium sp.]|nr:HDIG domain-containing protein [Desulfitobacterium sp.]
MDAKKIMEKLKLNTTWQQILALVVSFLLFTIILSSGLFVSKLNLELGDPSPQLVTAPYEKNIEDYEKYYEDQEAAAAAVEPVYNPDEEYLATVASDLSKAFNALKTGIANEGSIDTRLRELRKTAPFDVLDQETLTSLLESPLELLGEKEQRANEIIQGAFRDPDLGAKTQDEIPALRQVIKEQIKDAPFSVEFEVFLNEFVDSRIVNPTLILDEAETEKLRQQARATVKVEVHNYKAGQKIVGPGEIVDEKIMQVLANYGLVESRSPWPATVGIALIVLMSIFLLVFYTYQYRRDIPNGKKKLTLTGLVLFLVLALGKAVVSLSLGPELNNLVGILIPVAWATMTIGILVNVQLAYLTAAILAVVTGILVDPTFTSGVGWQIFLVAFFGGFVGVYSVSLLSQRSDLARAGIYVAAANVLTISGIALVSGMPLGTYLKCLGLGLTNGFFSSVLAIGTLHWFETGFGITSAVRLLELSNPNRPILKRLLMEAPGTYHHSILVGNLAEAAAEEVHANAILVRVGALYHDIGKLKRPYFFIENQFAQDNPHDKLAPTLSALIITSHIKDGIEMAKEEKLPQVIQDIIAQHHGDSVVSFFYHKAMEDNAEIPEEAFHYEGPRPQTKEAALVLLADSVEAAVRAMKQPTPGRIEGLVRKIIKDKLYDDQLSQCNLTFQDLDKIATAFVRILTGIYHTRVEYPDMPNKQGQEGKTESSAPQDKGDDSKQKTEKSQESQESKGSQETKELKDSEDLKESKGTKETQDSEESRGSKESQKPKEPKVSKESQDSKEAKKT